MNDLPYEGICIQWPLKAHIEYIESLGVGNGAS
jgi:hypothetical protein